MMDLDGFKAVNDKLGHQAGDHLLKELSGILLTQIRSSDFISRYAGDEFVAVLQAGQEEVQEASLRIQRALDRHDFTIANSKVFVGVSIGWACFGTDGNTLDELLLAADRAMYADKVKRKTLIGQTRSSSTGDLNQYRIM
jgi:diguanylate cyclase (GGDEF)-like protein